MSAGNRRFIVVGVTGGLASGKSSLCEMLADLGAKVVDADRISREITRPGAPTLRRLIERFGDGILGPSGELDRGALSRVAFSSPENLKDLNRLTHPAILDAIRDELEGLDDLGYDGVVAIEAALIVEEPRSRAVFDLIVAVVCSEATREKRVSAIAPEGAGELMRRSRAQLSDKKKAESADYVVWNDGDLRELEGKAGELWKWLVENKGLLGRSGKEQPGG